MIFEIETDTTIPIYTQLTQQIKQAILNGQANIGETLPSVRSLASDLGVNMHTVNKAYNILVDEGILRKNQQGYSIQFNETLREAPNFRTEVQEQFKSVLIDGLIHGITFAQFQEWSQEIAEELNLSENESFNSN